LIFILLPTSTSSHNRSLLFDTKNECGDWTHRGIFLATAATTSTLLSTFLIFNDSAVCLKILEVQMSSSRFWLIHIQHALPPCFIGMVWNGTVWYEIGVVVTRFHWQQSTVATTTRSENTPSGVDLVAVRYGTSGIGRNKAMRSGCIFTNLARTVPVIRNWGAQQRGPWGDWEKPRSTAHLVQDFPLMVTEQIHADRHA
jgi:hypothetical protein